MMKLPRSFPVIIPVKKAIFSCDGLLVVAVVHGTAALAFSPFHLSMAGVLAAVSELKFYHKGEKRQLTRRTLCNVHEEPIRKCAIDALQTPASTISG
jgi:hypothetical protein